jgi:hypothetical protein
MSGPFHTVDGTEITVYLNLNWSWDGVFPTDNILAEIARVWVPMAAAHGMTLAVGLSWESSPPPLAPPPAGITVIYPATPPVDVGFFTLEIGRGATADASTRATRTSYVSYGTGSGYIYHRDEVPTRSFVPAISHELGHILGLTDRYYEAMYWLRNIYMDRTCAQIRARAYVESGIDYRLGELDNPPGGKPRLAVRASLPMSYEMIVDSNGTLLDPDYDPLDNLMATSTSKLSPYQMTLIKTPVREQDYRTGNWVAILGDWLRYSGNQAPPAPPNPGISLRNNPDSPSNASDLTQWIYPAWEARTQDGGSGLLFRPPNSNIQQYPCVRKGKRGRRPNNDVVNPTLHSMVKGKKKATLFGGSTYNTNGISYFPEKMCHVRQLLFDLQRDD